MNVLLHDCDIDLGRFPIVVKTPVCMIDGMTISCRSTNFATASEAFEFIEQSKGSVLPHRLIRKSATVLHIEDGDWELDKIAALSGDKMGATKSVFVLKYFNVRILGTKDN